MSANLFLLLVLAPLGLLTTVYVVWPLLRRAPDPQAGGGDAQQLNREIVRERRAQLDRELAQLAPDSAERDRVILEFSAAAMNDLASKDAPSPRHQRPRWITAALLTGLMVAGPIAFYRLAGTPDAASPDFGQEALPQDLGALVAQLERRLQAEPGAADGWLLLGRSKMSLGDLAGATAALEKALALDSKDPALAAQIRVDLADAIAQGSATRLGGRPWSLIQEALQRDGANPKALALAGAYRVTQGDRDGALAVWEQLLALLPAGSEQHAQISAFVADLKAGRRPGARPAATAAAGPVLRGRVELDTALAASANAGDTVFIAVRAVDQNNRPTGPPAAVLRARVADLPLEFALSDAQAMSPAAKLSDQNRVVVVARISRDGTANASPGDLEGRSPVVMPDAQGVQVRIDRVVQ